MFSRMLRPMLAFPTEINGSEFGGRAVPAVLPAPERELPDEAPADKSLIARLHKLKPRTPDEKRLVQTMISELAAIELGANQLIDSIDGERNEELDAALEEVRAQGRHQQKVISKLEANRQRLEFEFHAARSEQEAALNQLSSLETTRVSRWASKEDRASLGQKIAKVKARVRTANEQLVVATSAHNQAADAVAEAHEVMGRISNRELVLRGQLSGQVYYDPETALPIVPR
jgi:hypothetical protein